jgi:hypothetical protein
MLSLYIVRDEPLEDGRTEYTYRWVAKVNYSEIERGTVTHNRADGWRALVKRIVEAQTPTEEAG